MTAKRSLYISLVRLQVCQKFYPQSPAPHASGINCIPQIAPLFKNLFILYYSTNVEGLVLYSLLKVNVAVHAYRGIIIHALYTALHTKLAINLYCIRYLCMAEYCLAHCPHGSYTCAQYPCVYSIHNITDTTWYIYMHF